jgi:hypothetical protein
MSDRLPSWLLCGRRTPSGPPAATLSLHPAADPSPPAMSGRPLGPQLLSGMLCANPPALPRPSSLLAGGIYQVRLQFPDQYPEKPPRVRFHTNVFHPNVFSDGTLCLDIIQDKWKPIYTVGTILTSVQVRSVGDESSAGKVHTRGRRSRQMAATAHPPSVSWSDTRSRCSVTLTTIARPTRRRRGCVLTAAAGGSSILRRPSFLSVLLCIGLARAFLPSSRSSSSRIRRSTSAGCASALLRHWRHDPDPAVSG